MKRSGSRTPALALLAALAGCAPELGSELRASGRFGDLAAIEAEGQGFAAALRDPGAAGGDLTVVRLADGVSCSAGPAEGFALRRGAADALAVVAWGDGRIAFYDAACRPQLAFPAARPTAVQEAIFGGRYRHHLALTTADARLLLVDPFAGDVVEPAEAPVHDFRWAAAERVWLHAGERLVLADLDGTIQRTIGGEVSEVAWTAEGVAFVDDGALFVVEDAGDPRRLADDACELHARPGGQALIYLSPCASRRLVRHDLAGGAEVLADGVGRFRHDTTPVFFVAGAPGLEVGSITTTTAAGPVTVAERGALSSVRRLSDGAHLLLAGDPGDADLLRFDGATRVLRSHVARFDRRHGHLAVLTDHGPEGGTLWLGEREDDLAVVAERVPRDGFGSAAQLRAFAFIADSRGGAGRLELIVHQTGDRLTIAEGVREVAELRSDATPGLVYVVAAGPDAGIWFAQPR